MDTLLGTTLDGYVLKRLLGSGGMGSVYLAEDPSIGQQVAIKVVRTDDSNYSDTASLEQATERFRQEARAVGSLDHLNILPLYRYGEEETSSGRRAYIVMQYRPEGSLADWLRRRSGKSKPSSQTLAPQLPEGLPTSWPLGLEEVAIYILQAASSLQYAHDRGIIHRDVKPANFLLRFDPQLTKKTAAAILLLSDFGLAKFYASTSATSHAFGTPIYMAPEQFDGTASPQSDQYALAVMAFHLLAGRPPFEGDPMHLMLQHLRTSPPSIHTLIPTVPRNAEEVLNRALAKQANQRFPSIMAFAEAFKEAAYGNSTRTLLRPFTLSLPTVNRSDEETQSRNNIFRASTALPPTPQSELGAVSEQNAAQEFSPYATEPQDFSGIIKNSHDLAFQAQTETPRQSDTEARTSSSLVRSQPMTPQPQTMYQAEQPIPQRREQRTSRRSALHKIFGVTALLAIGAGAGIYIARDHSPHPPVVANAINPQSIISNDHMLQKMLHGHSGAVTSVAWSPNGLFLASGSADNSVRQWDVEQGQSHVYNGHRDEVLSVAWSPNSSLLASGGKDTTVRIWNQTDPSNHPPIAVGTVINDLVWQHDNRSLFAGTASNGLCEVFLSLVGTGIAKPMFPGGQVDTRALAMSPDGHFLATGNELGIVNLYELSTMNLAFSKRLHQKSVLSLAWSSDGTLLASGSGDKHVQILEVSTTFNLLHTLPHPGTVNGIAWNPGDIRQIATISNDGNLYMWSMPDIKMTTYRNRAGIPTSLTWGVKGLVTGMRDGSIAIWNHLDQPTPSQ